MEITRQITALLEKRLLSFTPLIQIVLGPRQVGKSTAITRLLSKVPERSVYASFDNPGMDGQQLIRHYWERARAIPGHKILALDEIQNVAGWSTIVKELYDQDRPKRELSVVLLGSSALDLAISGEESLLGRFEIIRTAHWDYRECNEAFGWSLNQFLQYGGYPIIGEILTPGTSDELLRAQNFVRDAILEPILTRDILQFRSGINSALLRQTMQLALSYPCQEISYNKLLGQLQDRGNAATIKGYLELLEKAFVVRLLFRYSQGKLATRTSSPKIVPLAPALVHACNSPHRIGEDPAWTGLLFEMAIINKFAALGYDTFYWRNSRFDVDLVAKRDDQIIAVEVKYNAILDWIGLRAFEREYPNPKPKLLALDKHLGFEFLSTNDPQNWLRANGC